MKKRFAPHKRKVLFLSYTCFILASIIGFILFTRSTSAPTQAVGQNAHLTQQLAAVQKSYDDLKNQDQVKTNVQLKEETDAINKSYKDSIVVYEQMQDLKATKKDISQFEEHYAAVVKLLAERNYKEADAKLLAITTAMSKLFASPTSVASPTIAKTTDVPAAEINNSLPGNGFSTQTVQSDVGAFSVQIISADLNSTKVVVDTANDSDCKDNCPVMALGDFVSRSGAYAGINGSYFCPASYPTCAGKTNSFDTLVMNRNKTYLNSDNNVYSTVPLVVFSHGDVRFVGQSSGWGRDTSVDGVIANQPLLVSGGSVVFGGDGDPKKGSKGSRSFVASKGNWVYIGVVNNATVAEAAHVLKALGVEHALNLDSGGSTALWHGGYKVGPGRNIPNAILFLPR